MNSCAVPMVGTSTIDKARQVRFIGPIVLASSPITRGNDAWRTTTSSSAAARPARCWPTGCLPAAPTRCCCGGRAGHAARQVPQGDPRHLSRHRLFRPALPLDRAEGPHPGRLPQQPEREPPPLRKYEQARVLGGGSSINGQMANRGAPTDYDEWEARGAEGWNWDSVLPYFRKVERDLDFDDAVARQGGPHPRAPHPGRALARPRQGRRRGVQARRLSSTCPTRTASSRTAISPSPLSNDGKKRVSAAVGYLDAETRTRAEPDDLDRDPGKALLFEGTRCVGVSADGGRQGAASSAAREVILSSRRHPFAGHPAAQRHRPGRAPRGRWASRSRRRCPASASG